MGLSIFLTIREHSGHEKSDPEEHGGERSANSDAVSPPPLGVKLTCYRLFNMTAMSAFFIAKGILTYEGRSTMATTLDLFSGVVLAVG